jgi:hypothetical protein
MRQAVPWKGICGMFCRSHTYEGEACAQGGGILGALTIRPPTKRPRDTLNQAQFTHGPPPGSANKQFVVAGGGPGR